MNKRLFTRKILRPTLWLSLLTTLFMACQKGLESGFPWQEDQNSLTDPALPLDVSMAKSFYKNLKEKAGDQVIIYKVDNQPFGDELPVLKSQSSFTNRKTPLFSQASTYENAKNSYVEIPLFYNRRSAMIIAADSRLKGNPRAQERVFRASFDRLLVYKNKLSGKSGSYIITYQPSLAYLEKYGYSMENNRLNQLDTAFCGYLEYKTWEGKHLYYRQIENGKLVKVSNLATGRAVVYGRGQLQKTQKKVILKSQDDCGTIEVPTYTETCIQEDPEKSKETCVEVEGTAEKTEECEERNNEEPGANLCEEIGIDCPEGDYIFDEPSGPGVDDDGETNVTNNKYTAPPPSCRSFSYSKVNSNWQAACVTGVFQTYVDLNTEAHIQIDFKEMYFQMPYKTASGKDLSGEGVSATYSAQVLQDAFAGGFTYFLAQAKQGIRGNELKRRVESKVLEYADNIMNTRYKGNVTRSAPLGYKGEPQSYKDWYFYPDDCMP